MKIVKPSATIEYITPDPLQAIEAAARICYQSEPKGDGPAIWTTLNFVQRLIKRGHLTPLEMAHMRVRIVCDRGVSHELVRHRLCSFNQESTRYCRYDDGIEFVLPPWIIDSPSESKSVQTWKTSLLKSEQSYIDLLGFGWTPEQARSVLPNSLKTELVMTANFREWMHIFKLRCSEKSHPQMREIMIPLRDQARELVPVIFD